MSTSVLRAIARLDAVPTATDNPSRLTARLEGSHFHHLTRVLRAKPGQPIEIIDTANGIAVRGLLEAIADPVVTISDATIVPADLSPKITLCAALLKSAAMDFVVERTLEVGVSEIHLFNADRTQGRLKAADAERKLARYSRIAETVLKQGGMTSVPELQLHASLSDLLGTMHKGDPGPSEQRLCMVSGYETQSALLKDKIQEIPTLNQLVSNSWEPRTAGKTQAADALEKTSRNAEFYLIIGPEGGFTDPELETAKNCQYRWVSLGPRTLRAETAALVSTALLRIFLA